ncbi:M23 family metallopeptidase [Streptomyces bacillaris]|uniref:M23 family metallopeptidase n=3 Tax=Streptomyces TaxID=1883 RepID=A0AAD0Q5L9_9ACTN|nr:MULTISPECIES: M23 family metallopeptidase [Streptomyces]NUW22017.1 M23 family metallopeptidase [Streptomyces roseoviolaceus]ALC29238.1 peptidase [Streptomyces sp. CFMR 7]ATY96419.1 M23 family peptidase [Streptomyces cavourensis]AXI72279.1 M23 family peptidase [Streptomyces cavourensis]MBH0242038.1 M23 family metallopeptidase [Streptomyces cavourensis]
MKRATNQLTIRPSVSRIRGAVLAAGLGASVVLGAGTAFASGTTGATGTAALAAGTTAESVAQQATAQSKAAAKKASDAKKKAEDKKKAAKKNAASWKSPVKKYTLTASYGTGGARWAAKHSGQDFAVPVGTPVSAVHTGTVVKAGPNGAGDGPAYGNAVVIKHSNGKYSQYAHLSKVNVKIGQKVKTGQKIALSGNTGNSSGPHLHFEIRTTPNYGSALNPAAFLRSVHVSI